jgi:hypothetical protein
MRKVYFLILISFMSFQVGAQTATLRFVSTQYNLGSVSVDSVQQVKSFADSIYNTGSPYTGYVRFNAKINGGASFLLDSVFFALIDSGGSPNTALNLPINVPLGNPAFVSGPNGVVIWPIYNGHAGPDSIHISINITHLAGIEEAPLFKIYLMQHGGVLNVEFGDNQDLVKQVSFYDVSGRQIVSGSADQSHIILTGGWSTGIYFCEITTYKGERRTIRFLLQ